MPPRPPVPSPNNPIAPLLVGLGLALVLGGLLAWSGGLSWFGRLPGDLHWERGTVRVSVPLVSMLVVSLVLSAVLRIVRRFL